METKEKTVSDGQCVSDSKEVVTLYRTHINHVNFLGIWCQFMFYVILKSKLFRSSIFCVDVISWKIKLRHHSSWPTISYHCHHPVCLSLKLYHILAWSNAPFSIQGSPKVCTVQNKHLRIWYSTSILDEIKRHTMKQVWTKQNTPKRYYLYR